MSQTSEYPMKSTVSCCLDCFFWSTWKIKNIISKRQDWHTRAAWIVYFTKTVSYRVCFFCIPLLLLLLAVIDSSRYLDRGGDVSASVSTCLKSLYIVIGSKWTPIWFRTRACVGKLSFSLIFCPLHIQSDPVREGEPHVQREPGHRLRPDADEGPRAGRHDGAQRHPIPETRGGSAHYQRRRVVLRGGGEEGQSGWERPPAIKDF